MTPAEELASKKPKRQVKRKKPNPGPWHCLISEERRRLGLTLEEVASATKISKTAIWQIDNGGDVLLTTAHKLAVFFGKSIDQLWVRT